jgi:hypothetical protein
MVTPQHVLCMCCACWFALQLSSVELSETFVAPHWVWVPFHLEACCCNWGTLVRDVLHISMLRGGTCCY